MCLSLHAMEAAAAHTLEGVMEEEAAAWRAVVVKRAAFVMKLMRVQINNESDSECSEEVSEEAPSPCALSMGSSASALSLLSLGSRSPMRSAPCATMAWIEKARGVLRNRSAVVDDAPFERQDTTTSFGGFSSVSCMSSPGSSLRSCLARRSTTDLGQVRQQRRVRLSDAVTYRYVEVDYRELLC